MVTYLFRAVLKTCRVEGDSEPPAPLKNFSMLESEAGMSSSLKRFEPPPMWGSSTTLSNAINGLVTGSGPIIPFFNAPTRFPDGAATLSIRTGAPVLIGVTIRKKDGSFEAVIEPLRSIERTGNAKRDVLLLTQAIAERLEYYVANHPEQWTVFQRRWPLAKPG